MKIKAWELALAAAVVIAALSGTALEQEQKALSERIVRLHVVANSDSREDQSLKLKVRDAVLAELSDELSGASDATEASELIESRLDVVGDAARGAIAANGYEYPAVVTLGVESFPTREYDTFSLPAGDYTSLRVVIGDGAGKNWWCVMFPPICTEAVVDWDTTGLSAGQVSLITEDDESSVVKFRALELLARLRELFR